MGASSLPPPLTVPGESTQTENKGADPRGAALCARADERRIRQPHTDLSSRHGSEFLLPHGEMGSFPYSLWSWNGGDQQLPLTGFKCQTFL